MGDPSFQNRYNSIFESFELLDDLTVLFPAGPIWTFPIQHHFHVLHHQCEKGLYLLHVDDIINAIAQIMWLHIRILNYSMTRNSRTAFHFSPWSKSSKWTQQQLIKVRQTKQLKSTGIWKYTWTRSKHHKHGDVFHEYNAQSSWSELWLWWSWNIAVRLKHLVLFVASSIFQIVHIIVVSLTSKGKRHDVAQDHSLVGWLLIMHSVQIWNLMHMF